MCTTFTSSFKLYCSFSAHDWVWLHTYGMVAKFFPYCLMFNIIKKLNIAIKIYFKKQKPCIFWFDKNSIISIVLVTFLDMKIHYDQDNI